VGGGRERGREECFFGGVHGRERGGMVREGGGRGGEEEEEEEEEEGHEVYIHQSSSQKTNQ